MRWGKDFEEVRKQGKLHLQSWSEMCLKDENAQNLCKSLQGVSAFWVNSKKQGYGAPEVDSPRLCWILPTSFLSSVFKKIKAKMNQRNAEEDNQSWKRANGIRKLGGGWNTYSEKDGQRGNIIQNSTHFLFYLTINRYREVWIRGIGPHSHGY